MAQGQPIPHTTQKPKVQIPWLWLAPAILVTTCLMCPCGFGSGWWFGKGRAPADAGDGGGGGGAAKTPDEKKYFGEWLQADRPENQVKIHRVEGRIIWEESGRKHPARFEKNELKVQNDAGTEVSVLYFEASDSISVAGNEFKRKATFVYSAEGTFLCQNAGAKFLGEEDFVKTFGVKGTTLDFSKNGKVDWKIIPGQKPLPGTWKRNGNEINLTFDLEGKTFQDKGVLEGKRLKFDGGSEWIKTLGR